MNTVCILFTDIHAICHFVQTKFEEAAMKGKETQPKKSKEGVTDQLWCALQVKMLLHPFNHDKKVKRM